MATGSGALGFAIGEVSRAVGLAPQTIRLWEREGLVKPTRTEKGYRIYGEEDIQRLQKIKYYRMSEGLNFAAIRKVLGPPRDRDCGDESELQGEHSPGERLRRLRMKTRRTLKEVSEDTGLSISFISALERGGSGASVASLRLLAGSYGVTMKELFGADIDQREALVREEERIIMKWENGVRFEEMSSGNTTMDPSYIRVPAGTGSEGFYTHEGEEFIYVISGVLYVELADNDVHQVGPGDTLYFHSSIPHRWWAEGEPVEAVYVNSPPTF